MIARDVAGVCHVNLMFFVPLLGINDRSRRDAASYDLWARQGLIEATSGASVDYATVAQRLCELCDQLDVRVVGYDRWRTDVLKAELARFGWEFVVRDPAGNRKLDKSKATSRIDGLVALAIAFGVAHSEVTVARQPNYQVFFVG